MKKHEAVTNYPLIIIYVNKIEHTITFKVKAGYYIELLKPETMRLLGSTKSEIIKDENGENVSHLEITEVILVRCKIVNNDYQQHSRLLYTYVRNKSFGQLLDMSPKSFMFLNTFNSECSYIEVNFSEQNSKPLEIEDKINITLVIN